MQRAFIITDLSRSGAQTLLEALEEFFDVEVVPPVFLPIYSLDDPAIVDQAAFVARNTRPAMLGEVGCAMAHRAVYERMLEQRLPWALVLEDDISVPSVSRLSSRLEQVVETCSTTEAVIFHFNSGRLAVSRMMHPGPLPGSVRPAIQPFTTECYAVNSKAAELLALRQSPVSSTADWPSRPGEVAFFIESRELVVRREKASSQIDPGELRRRSSMRVRLQLWTCTWYYLHHDHFASPGDFAVTVLKPRFYVRLYRVLNWLWPVRGDLGT